MSSEEEKVILALQDPSYEYDVNKAFAQLNPNMTQHRGRDRFSYTEESYYHWTRHHQLNEARHSHGYPYTTALQAGIIGGCALLVAKEQGYPLNYPFWKAHYYNWTKFLTMGFKYGVVGGLVLGTVLFGNPTTAISRCVHYYKHYTEAHDPTTPAFDVHYLPNRI